MIPNLTSLMVMIDLTILIIIAIAVTSNVRSRGRIRRLSRTPNGVLLPVGLMILGGWFLADAAGRTALPALTEWRAFEEVIGSVALIGIGLIALGQHRLLRSTVGRIEALNAYPLSESDRLLRTVIDAIPQQVFVKDSEARFNLVNRAWGDFYGIDPAQCVGYTTNDLPVANTEALDRVRETDRQVLKSGETVDEVQSIELHSGAKQIRRLYKVPLRDEDGGITGIIGFSEDITDRVRAEEKLEKEEEYSRHLIETMNDGFGVVDRRGVITYANNKLCRIFGYPKEELEGWRIAERGLLDEENQRRLDEEWADSMKGESHPYELTITCKDGRRTVVHVSPRPTFDEQGAFDGSVSVFTDITQQKSFEATLLDKQWIFDQAQQLANIGIWERDLRTSTLEWSAQTCRIFGWEPDNRHLTQDDLIAAIHPEDRETFIGIVKTAGDRDGLFDYEHRIIRTDGAVRYVHEIGATLYDEEGQPVRRFGSVHDITDRKKAEIALEENRRLLQTVFESLPIGLFVKDADAKLIMVNEAHAKNLEFDASDMMGRRTTALGLGTQAEMQLMDDSDQLVLKQGERFESTESPWTMPNGETTWWHVVKAPLKDDEGNIIGVVGARMDITERKEAQEELRLHSAIMNEMAEGVFLFRASDGVIVYSNPRNDELFGYEPEELVGNHVSIVNASGESLPDETSEKIIQSLKSTGSWVGDVQNVRKGGSKFWCRARISTMEHHQLGTIWISVNENITERKQAEIDLSNNRRLLQKIFESIPIGVFVKDREGRLIMANEAHAAPLEISAAEMIGRHAKDMGWGSEENRQGMDETDHLVLDQGERYEVEELPWTLPNGEVSWWHVVKAPFHDENGNILGIVGARIEITERIQATRSLKMNEELLAAVFDSLPMAVGIKDREGRYLKVNHLMADFYEMTEEEMVGKSVMDLPLSSKERLQTILEDDRKVMVSGHPIINPEVEVVAPSGEISHRYIAKLPLRDDRGEVSQLLVVSQDITERKKAELALEDQKRLLQTVFDALPHWIFMKDRAGRFQMVNQALSSYFGMSPQDLIGKTFEDLAMADPEQVERSKETDFMVLEEGKSYAQEELLVFSAEGKSTCRHVIKVPSHDVQGNVEGLVGISMDITEQRLAERELENNRRFLNTVLDSLPHPVFVKDQAGRYRFVNRALKEVYGVDEDHIIAQNYDHLPRVTTEERLQVDEEDALVFDTGLPLDIPEKIIPMADGSQGIFHIQKIPLGDWSTGDRQLVGISENITELKNAEEKLRENEARLQNFIDSSPSNLAYVDQELRYQLVNARYLDYIEKTEDELIGYTIAEVMGEETLELYRPWLEAVLEGEEQHFEVSRHLGDQGGRDLEVRYIPNFDSQGRVLGFHSSVQDITERKEAEERLRESRTSLALAQEISHVGSWDWVIPMGELKWSDEIFRIFGLKPQQFEPSYEAFLEAIHPEDREKVLAAINGAVQGDDEYSVEHRIKRPNGTIRYVHERGLVFRDQKGAALRMLGAIQDITERKEAEETLRENQRLMETVFNALPLWVTVKDLDLRYILHNKQVLTDLQMKAEELMASNTETLAYGTKEDKSWVYELDRKILDGEETNLVSEIPVNLPDGRKRVYHSIKVPLLDGQGGITGVVNVSQDITDRKEAEEKLRENEQLLQTIFEALPVWVSVKDTQLRYQMVNAASLADTGLTEEQYLNSVTVDLPLGKGEEMERNLALDRKVLESGEKITSPEHPHTLADGNVHYFHHIKAPYRDSSGNIRGIVTVSLDVTERKEAEEKIRESRNRLNNFIDSSPINLAYLDKDLIYRQVNARYLEFLGRSKEEIVGQTAMEVVGPENFELYRPHLEEAMRGHEVHFEVSRLLGGKKTHHLEIKYAPDTDQMGNVLGMYASLQDITKRKEGEEKLRESQRLLQNVFDTIPSRLFVKDQNSRYILVNKKFADDFDTKPEVWTGRQAREIDALTEEEKLEFTDSDNEVFSSGQSLNNPEYLSILRDGTRKYFHFIKELMRDDQGEINGLIGLAVDISEQVRAEKDVKANQRLLRTVFDTIPEQVFVKDKEGHYLMVNRAWADLFRIDPERCMEYTADDLPVQVTNLQDEVRNTDHEVLNQGCTQVIPRLEIRLEDGTEQIQRVFKAPLLGEEGDIKGIVGFSQNITEQVRAEEELLKHRDQLEVLVTERTTELEEERNFIDTVLDTQEALVMVMDRTGKIVRFNNACVRLTGFSEEELIGAPFFDLIVPEENREATTFADRELKVENFPANHENPLITKSGEQRLVAWSTNVLLDAKGEVEFVISAGIDTTERKRLEGELVQQQKLATLGQLTATVSHELRNPLGTMRTTMGVIGRIAIPDDDVMTRALARMDRSITRCDNIIDEMLDYTRMKNPDLRPMVLDRWLRVMLEDLEAPRGIEVLQRLEAPGAKVSIDPDRFLRVLINLYENACQAMEGQKSKEGVVPEGRLRIITNEEDGQVILTVEDNGPGIPPGVLGKIFEPLFSTKNFGVGLGLSIVQNIVDQHRAEILVETEVGRGTRFIIRFPRHS